VGVICEVHVALDATLKSKDMPMSQLRSTRLLIIPEPSLKNDLPNWIRLSLTVWVPKNIHTVDWAVWAPTVLASAFSVLSPFSAFSTFVSAIRPEAELFRQPPGGGSKLTPASSEVVLTLEKSMAHTLPHVATVMTVTDMQEQTNIFSPQQFDQADPKKNGNHN
jgi:hypothetical protein